MGDWSTRMTSWTCSAPSTPAQFTPAPAGPPLRGDAGERWMPSGTSVDLPEPETPVTATIRPRGISMSMFCRLCAAQPRKRDRKSTRLNSSHGYISYAVFCLKKKKYIFYTGEYRQPHRVGNLGRDVSY